MRKLTLLAAITVLAVSLPTLQADAKSTSKNSASAYAPGQMAKKPNAQAAKYYAPGQRMNRGETRPVGTTGASGFAPGQVKETGTTGLRSR